MVTRIRKKLGIFAGLGSLVIATVAFAQTDEQAKDKGTTLKAGEEGTVLESITVEGEDRVSVDFERPQLRLALDPSSAPGLDWEFLWKVLDASYIDTMSPFIKRTAYDHSPYYTRIWLNEYRVGDVAVFRPELESVERWSLVIADSRSQTVASFTGKGSPPEEIRWDGRDSSGKPVPPGPTYSYVLEAADKAGNKRSFVGEGFKLPPYVSQTKDQFSLLFPADAMESDAAATPRVLLDAATRINQLGDGTSPVRVSVTARNSGEANDIAASVVEQLRGLLLGDPGRVEAEARVATGASRDATVAIHVAP